MCVFCTHFVFKPNIWILDSFLRMWVQSQSNILHWVNKFQHDSHHLPVTTLCQLQMWLTLKNCQFYTKLQVYSPSATLPLLYQATYISCSETLILLYHTTVIIFIWNNVTSLPNCRHKMIWNNVTSIPNYTQQVHPKHCYFSKLHGVISNSTAITQSLLWEHHITHVLKWTSAQ